MSDIYEGFLNRWKTVAAVINSSEQAKASLQNAKYFEERVVRAAHESRVKNVPRPLIGEFSRIYTLSVRRFRALIACAEQSFTDVVIDETRALMEMMFQSFYLIRHKSPAQAALDAINLSAISEHKTRVRLERTKQIPPLKLTPEQAQTKNRVLREIFPKYQGRKPRFYADLKVWEVAERAKLKRVHELLYGALSASLHNEPVRQLTSIEGNYIAVIPTADELDKLWDTVSLATQVFVLTALSALCAFADTDKKYITDTLDAFETCYPTNDWNHEIDTIRDILDKP